MVIKIEPFHRMLEMGNVCTTYTTNVKIGKQMVRLSTIANSHSEAMQKLGVKPSIFYKYTKVESHTKYFQGVRMQHEEINHP